MNARSMARTLAMLAAIATWTAPHPAAQDQRSVFSSGVEAVRVDVLVTQNRKPVPGLRAEDFQVTDNGVPQRVDFVSLDEVPINVVIALDLSSSLTGERMAQLRRASASLASVLKTDDQAGLVTFTETVVLSSGLTRSLDTVRAGVARAEPAAGTRPTALVDAVFATILAAESDVGRGLVVVFSDGVDTGSWLRGDAVVEIAKRSDAVVYAVATKHAGRDDFLADLTRATGGGLIELEATDDIGSAFLAVVNEFRYRYLISYTPSGTGRDGWHEVSVKVRGRDVKVTSRPGYWRGRDGGGM